MHGKGSGKQIAIEGVDGAAGFLMPDFQGD